MGLLPRNLVYWPEYTNSLLHDVWIVQLGFVPESVSIWTPCKYTKTFRNSSTLEMCACHSSTLDIGWEQWVVLRHKRASFFLNLPFCKTIICLTVHIMYKCILLQKRRKQKKVSSCPLQGLFYCTHVEFSGKEGNHVQKIQERTGKKEGGKTFSSIHVLATRAKDSVQYLYHVSPCFPISQWGSVTTWRLA